MKHKQNKKQFDTNKINKVVKIISAVCAVICIVIIGFMVYRINEEQTQINTVEDLFAKAQEEANRHDYAVAVITRYEQTGEEEYLGEYTVSAERENSTRTYMFRDSDSNSLYQAWQLQPNSLNYDVYIYATDPGQWVKTSLGYEPVTVNLWDMFKYAEGYTLMEDTYKWYNTDDDCYVLQLVGDADDWKYVYEEVYIRKSDYMPMGIVLAMIKDDENVDGHTITQEGFEINGIEGNAEITLPGSQSLIQKYDVVFCDEDQKLFEIPTEYITDEEYLNYIHQNVEENTDE